jgi:ferric-dicitrate binding protein FerR (iron transport regulator)
MTAPEDSKGRRALTALAELARGSVRPPSPGELESGLQTLSARVAVDRPGGSAARRRAILAWSLVGAFAAASAIVVIGVVRRDTAHLTAPATPRPLTYRVEGGTVVDGGYLRESDHGSIKLVFAEGTEFILMPGTRSRLRAVDASGARIAIEHGTASFQVTPAKDHRWQVDVGPFLVTVKGTVFTVSWDAAAEKFELRLRHGRVTVSGPVNGKTTGGEIDVQAGQRLRVDLPRGETVISDQSPDELIDSPTAPAVHPSEPRAERASPPRNLDGDHRWSAALAAGRLDRILAEAERAGVKTTLDRASSDDLLALADAARYRRRMDLARDALLAERRRFPDSPRSLDAAFLLGRVEEATDSGLARAVEWYDVYLTRAPTGTYASEALGRKMTLTSRLDGASRARPIAEEYLLRFPNGTYAGPARAFVRGP